MSNPADHPNMCPKFRKIWEGQLEIARNWKPSERTQVQKELDQAVAHLFQPDFKPVMIEVLKLKGIRRIGT